MKNKPENIGSKTSPPIAPRATVTIKEKGVWTFRTPQASPAPDTNRVPDPPRKSRDHQNFGEAF